MVWGTLLRARVLEGRRTVAVVYKAIFRIETFSRKSRFLPFHHTCSNDKKTDIGKKLPISRFVIVGVVVVVVIV